MYSSRQEPFLVTETNAGSIGGSAMNFPAYDGQWRQVAWAMVARGARMVEYWHWHTLHYGTETYWIGVLPHDQAPGRVYDQLAALGDELRRGGDAVAGLVPDAHVGLLYSQASKWALEFQPALADGAVPDRRSYEHIVEAFYRGCFAAGAQVRMIHDVQVESDGEDLMDPAATAAELPVLIVPALYVASDRLLDWLAAYAAAGGHLVLGPRTGYADPEARARLETKPGRLAEAAGVRYQEFANLGAPVPVRGTGGFELPQGAQATGWVDALLPGGAEVLAEYEHPHHGAFPAVVSAAHGAGRVTTVGTVPDDDFARALVARVAPVGEDRWRALVAGSVTVLSGTNADGARVRFVHNWSWDPTTVTVPAAVRDVLAGTTTAADGRVELGAWDVRVLVEE
jgi:beta-galactosidase